MSRKIIKTQTVSDKKERDEIAQMSARAKKEVVEAQTKVEEAQVQFKELMRKIDNNVSIHKNLKGRIEKAENRLHKDVLLHANMEQQNAILKEENDKLTALHSVKETEIKRISYEVEDYKVKLSAVQSDLSELKDRKVRAYAEIKAVKDEIQSIKSRSGSVHAQTIAFMEQSKLLQANIELQKNELAKHKEAVEEAKNASDIKITASNEELARVSAEIDTKTEQLKQLNVEIAKELEGIKSERKGAEIYRGHNIRLLNELNIKVKEAKAYRENQIIGEYLTKNGL